ncbi:RidA family protein [Myxococcus sp. CA040A]|uniref:RidA family protein n=1 Tax=Myxococcus llanfairpwllgwyngyllgogerychwyrndrobwllllantysiliogogogochensis TaxID=2590453 RepID=UPI00157A5F19|nr:RidA family protein [Myxococcus llanfairpwllgwyngyllgogerychwyrndrobwllllantysiliogogogochensis]NTX07987.1 RidA family protein [Myxococcus sp. CA040A]NTX14784.1 RidA family protein [Myxococcus sp. CA056]NTX40597.1 RidA family protein [Myxococcus sp. CA033]NTX57341.1 RidA family protein [Myxococcus sp. CA039A]
MRSMARKTLHSDQAPKAIGPYSQAVQVDAGKLTFLSGQIPLDPVTMEMVQGDVVAQAERVMLNLQAVLAAGGLDFSHVVRCTIFLTDLGDFAKVNEVYGRYFTGAPPARATVQVAALPRGSKVEIDAIAVS